MGQAAYTASKAGIVGMTLPIARDLMTEGIRVNTILPGIFDTPLLAQLPDRVKTAGRDKTTGEPTHFPLDAFNRIIQINLVGTFRCIAKSAKGMLSLSPLADGERGAIVNTASVAAQDGQIGQASYSASKAGIVGMTLPIARDLMGEGIRVNTILPGIFDTPLLARLPEHVKSALAASVPFPKRLGHPDEYAALAEFMITTGYVNGECVRLDGAIRMAPR